MSRILLIDSCERFRGMLKQVIFNNYTDIEIDDHDPSLLGIPSPNQEWDKYGLIFIEYKLGLDGQNGLDWIKIMREYKDIPNIVMLTDESDWRVIFEAGKLGITDYLFKKDINSENIVDKLGKFIEIAREIYQDTSSRIMLVPENIEKSIDNFFDDKVESPPSAEFLDLTIDPDADIDDPVFDESFLVEDIDIEVPGYNLQKKITEGGMATVFLAQRIEDGLSVILKVLYTNKDTEPQALKRFMREYNMISSIDHHNVIKIYERAFASKFSYIAMEYFPAGDMSSRVKRGIGHELSLNYLRQIACGLVAIHEHEIVHRDLKPGNILFRDDGSLTITDFGAAKRLSGEDDDLTSIDTVVGTPYYMSPEQGAGMRIDERSDLYSLGVVYYQMLTGNRLFTAKDIPSLIEAHLTRKIPELLGVLSKYQSLLQGMLAKDPTDRFQTAEDLLAGIDWTSKQA